MSKTYWHQLRDRRESILNRFLTLGGMRAVAEEMGVTHQAVSYSTSRAIRELRSVTTHGGQKITVKDGALRIDGRVVAMLDPVEAKKLGLILLPSLRLRGGK